MQPLTLKKGRVEGNRSQPVKVNTPCPWWDLRGGSRGRTAEGGRGCLQAAYPLGPLGGSKVLSSCHRSLALMMPREGLSRRQAVCLPQHAPSLSKLAREPTSGPPWRTRQPQISWPHWAPHGGPVGLHGLFKSRSLSTTCSVSVSMSASPCLVSGPLLLSGQSPCQPGLSQVPAPDPCPPGPSLSDSLFLSLRTARRSHAVLCPGRPRATLSPSTCPLSLHSSSHEGGCQGFKSHRTIFMKKIVCDLQG